VVIEFRQELTAEQIQKEISAYSEAVVFSGGGYAELEIFIDKFWEDDP